MEAVSFLHRDKQKHKAESVARRETPEGKSEFPKTSLAMLSASIKAMILADLSLAVVAGKALASFYKIIIF